MNNSNLSLLMKDVSAEIGLDKMPPEEQQETLKKIGDIIFQRVMMRMIEELSEEAKTELDKLLEEKKNDPEVMLTFLRSKISNFDDLVMEEVVGFKKEATDLMLAVKKGV
ncbi:MAG: hypothetical protein NTU97_03975 [Candidatus Magasanikbacteria bacterium]|nr:hypothetical protein [Candidatus Magasanikbacteria bacterium]